MAFTVLRRREAIRLAKAETSCSCRGWTLVGSESSNSLDADVDAGRLPDLPFLRAYFGPDPASVPLIDVEVVPLSAYDELAFVAAGAPEACRLEQLNMQVAA